MNYVPHQGPWGPLTQGVYPRAEPIQTSQSMQTRSRYDGYVLRVLQHPMNGKVAIGKEKDRKPLDPPPFVQLDVQHNPDTSMHLQSPYLLVYAYLEPAMTSQVSTEERKNIGSYLMGTTGSSLHRLKDMKNQDIAVFVFPDLTVKKEGQFKIRFVLMNLEEDIASAGEWVTICQCYSEPFTVHSARTFPGMAESTPLTRMFADQGVRVRLRKDSRQLTTKKQNNNFAKSISQKRGREHSSAQGSEAPDIESHRGSVVSPDRTYYDTQQPYAEAQEAKRQRTASIPGGSYQMRSTVQSLGSYPSYPTMTTATQPHAAYLTTAQSHQPIFAPSFHSRDSYSHNMAMSLPRGGSTRLDTQVGQYQNELFTSPSTHQSPGNPYSYGASSTDASPSVQHTPGTQNPSVMPYFPAGDQQLPALNQALNANASHVNASPQAHPHSIHTPVSSTGSPIEGVYTHATPQYQQTYMPQSNGSFDQGTLRANGISTPVTADIPQDSMHGTFMGGQIISPGGRSYAKANQDT